MNIYMKAVSQNKYMGVIQFELVDECDQSKRQAFKNVFVAEEEDALDMFEKKFLEIWKLFKKYKEGNIMVVADPEIKSREFPDRWMIE